MPRATSVVGSGGDARSPYAHVKRPCYVRRSSLPSRPTMNAAPSSRSAGATSSLPTGAHRSASAIITADVATTSAYEASEFMTEEEAIRAARQLRSLFLSDRSILSMNHIRHLEHMTSLRSINLHMNLLKHVECPPCIRQGLVELDLSANEIGSLSNDCFMGMQQLRRLNLSSNFIRTLPAGCLAPLLSLEWLSLAFNELTRITELKSIPSASPLAYVDLSGNSIASVCDVTEALVAHQRTLKELRLLTPQGGTTGVPQGYQQQQPHPVVRVRENPLCSRPSNTGGRYTDEVLALFTGLHVLDGVTYGLDPVAEASAARRAAAAAAEKAKEEEEGQQLRKISTQGLHIGQQPSVPLFRPRHTGHHRHCKVDDEVESSSSRDFSSHSSSSFTSDSSSSASSRDAGRSEKRGVRSRSGHSRASSTSHLDAKEKEALNARTRSIIRTSTQTGTSSTPTKALQKSRKLFFKLGPSMMSEKNETSAAAAASSINGTDTTPEAASKARGATVDVSLSPQYVTPECSSADSQASPPLSSSSSGSSTALVVTSTEASSRASAAVLGRRISASREASAQSELNWRPKRVSRGTNTAPLGQGNQMLSEEEGKQSLSNSHSVAIPTSAVKAREAHLEEALKQAQLQLRKAEEQLSLRLSIESDLRARLGLTARQAGEVQAQAACREKQLRAQVTALKDELLRRNQEAGILHRNHKAELAGVEARLSKTLVESQKYAAGLKDELSTSLAKATERVSQLHSAQIENERQVAAMTAESERMQREGARTRASAEYIRVCAEEAILRRTLQLDWAEQAAGIIHAMHSTAVHAALKERRRLLAVWEQHQQTWEEYSVALKKEHEKTLARVVEQLRSKEADEAARRAERVAVECQTNDGATQAVTEAPLAAAALKHLQQMCERQDAELTRLRTTCAVAEETQVMLGKENTRLLAQVEELQHEKGEHQKQCQSEANARERENMLRTIHNLQEDLRKKDEALDALETEARAKLEEKREHIAELVGRVEMLEEDATRMTQRYVTLQEELDTAKRALAADVKEKEQTRAAAGGTLLSQQAQQQLEERVRELVAQQALHLLQSHQHATEKAAVVAAVAQARDQMVRLRDSHAALLAESREKAAALVVERERAEGLRKQLDQIQEASRAKQRATVEALSRMMLADAAL